jgi:hypothetical protein
MNHVFRGFVLFSMLGSGFLQAAPSPEALLKSADRSRGGLEKGLSWEIQIDTTEGAETSSRQFLVKAKGDLALAEATAPTRNKGEVFLFQGRNMWFARPGIRRPVTVSSRQRLSGQAANGDIASTHYSRDYAATLERAETLAGKPCQVLLLKAREKNVTYDQIRYWISDDKNLGLQAEFLSLNGKVLKRASFEYAHQMQSGGQSFPFVSKMLIEDVGASASKSVITYKSPQETALSDDLFQVNRLIR